MGINFRVSDGDVVSKAKSRRIWCVFFEDCVGLCDEPLFRLAIQAAQAINEFFRLLYSSDLWLPPEVARRAAELMFRFLRRYESCALLSYEEGRTLFILQPKLHTLQHCAITLLQTAGRNMEGLNPLCWSTQMSEDFVGRQSRLSRRVSSSQQTITRVIHRYLQAAYGEFVKCGYLR